MVLYKDDLVFLVSEFLLRLNGLWGTLITHASKLRAVIQ